MDQTAYFKLVKARIALIMEQPFFGQLALRLQLVEDTTIPTLAVDGIQVMYNPDFVNEVLDYDTSKSAMCHEIGHVVLDTIDRLGGRDPARWNMATDYKINQMLEEAGMRLGDGWLRNKSYDAMTADEIYNLIPPDQGKKPGEDGGPLDQIQPGKLSAGEKADWQIATIQAATVAAQAGKLPGSLKRLVDDIVNPRVDWKRVLREFARETSKDDYSWTKPNRRMLAHGLILPSMYSEAMGTMVIMVDTSGSIDDKLLSEFSGEINSIRETMMPENTIVIYCDSKINKVEEFGRYDEFKIRAVGGGGTDFRPPFKYLEEHSVIPACAVYLTDGYGPFPDTTPFPMLWCITTDVEAPCGQTVHITL